MSHGSNIISGPEQESEIPNESMGKYFFDCLKKRPINDVVNVDAQTLETLTCGQLLEDSIKLTAGLKALDLNKGDVISIVSENSLHYCVPVLAALYVGVTVNPLNPVYALGELKHALSLSKPKVVFCSESVLANVLNMKSELDFIKTVIVMGPQQQGQSEVQTVKQLLEAANIDTLTFKPDEFDCSEQVAFICQSSGTTGLPKGVLLTHENLRTPVGYLTDPRYGNLSSKDVSIGVLPFFHIFGLVLQIAIIVTSAKLVIMDTFRPDVFLKAIQDHKVTKLFIVPSLLGFLMASPLVKDFDITSVKDIVCGGAPVGKEYQEKASRMFPKIKIRQVYGLTETCGGCTFQTAEANEPGSVGGLIPRIQAKVLDLESNQAAGPTVVGELCFKGSMIMKGYVGDPGATKNSIDEDGFYHTGDVGYYDKNALFFIVDRVKELIKYKGFQVPPAELEALINTHPGVIDSCVIGIPDERAGELPLAYVVKKPDANVTERDIKEFVAERISEQKHLYGGVKFIDQIPKNPSGKLLRRVLKEKYNESK